MSYYIGPERRNGRERRVISSDHMFVNVKGSLPDRRIGPERRQQALSGVIAGLTAEQMQELAMAWKAWEASAPTTRKEP